MDEQKKEKKKRNFIKTYFSKVSCVLPFERGHRRLSTDFVTNSILLLKHQHIEWDSVNFFCNISHQKQFYEHRKNAIHSNWPHYGIYISIFLFYICTPLNRIHFFPFASNHFLSLYLFLSFSFLCHSLSRFDHNVNKYCHLMHKI